MKIYGYVRVSTLEQNEERQIKNIKKKYPDAIILSDEFTGKTMDRPIWNKLYPKLKKGDVLVFDEVSRMSRNAEEGFETYQRLYEKGVELIFLKEPHINSSVYMEVAQAPETGDRDLDETLIKGLNEYLMRLAKKQIQLAFEQSQHETEFRAQRVTEGKAGRREQNERALLKYGSVEEALKHPEEFKPDGRLKGDKLHIKKAEPIKALIREYSRDFDGHNTDAEVLAVLSAKTVKIPNKKRSGKVEEREISAKISRNTLYKYKKEIKEGV